MKSNMPSLLSGICSFPMSRGVVVTIALLLWSNVVFCDEIHDFARHGELGKIKALIKYHPDLVSSKDADFGGTPLLWAAMMGHKDVVAFLLANGADVNARDNFGATPLFRAVAGRACKGMAELLLAHEAVVDAKDKNDATPLLQAALDGNRDMVALLVAKGADVNAMDKSGDTPLHVASEQDRGSLKQIMLVCTK